MIATWESTSVMSKSKPTTALTFQAYGECRVGTRWRNVVWMSTNARRRSLADDLRHRTDAELEDFLKDRPDLLHPLPADGAGLARGAGAGGSIRRALGQLDRRTLNVAFAVAAQPGPVEIAAIRSAVVAAAEGEVDPEAVDEAVASAVEELTRVGLLWDDGVRRHPLREFRDTAIRLLTDPEGPDGTIRPEATVTDWRPTEVEVAKVLDHVVVDRASGQQGLLAVQSLEDVVVRVTEEPLRLLRTGAVPPRELAGLAEQAGYQRLGDAAMVVEMCVTLGLLAPSRDGDELRPTVAWSVQQEADAAITWAAMLCTWWRSQRAWEQVDVEQGEILADSLASTMAMKVRHRWATLLAEAPAGSVVDVDSAARVLADRFPLIDHERQRAALSAVARQAESLGFTGRGALSTVGRWFVEHPEVERVDPLDPAASVPAQLVALCGEVLPPSVDHVLLQGDLTAVAPGPLSAGVARRLRQFADVESTGGATVYRLSVASIERGLDLGWTQESLLAALTELSTTGVPQPLDYLVRDTAARHGRLRVSAGASYLTSAEPSELDLALATAERSGVDLRRIADTVAVSELASDVLVARLRESGLAATSADGARSSSGPESLAHVTTWPTYVVDESEPSAALLGAALTALRLEGVVERNTSSDSAPDPAAPDVERMHSAQIQTVLAAAIGNRRRVWVRHADNAGQSSVRLVEPIALSGGIFQALDVGNGQQRSFAVSRIVGVSPLETERTGR